MERVIDSEVAASASTLPAIATSARSPYTFRQRLRSGYHVFWYRLGEALCWSRGIYRERPAIRLAALTGRQQERILFLKRRYAVRFDRYGAPETALKSYDYLNILDQAWTAWGQSRPSGVAVHDVGSSNFWYARVLQSFFRPSALTGVEVEGYRIYANGYSRWDYAQGYVQGLPQTSCVVSNYAQYDQKADVVMAWYPFVTPAPVLAWRLPLALLAPRTLFAQIASNLTATGLFVMVNQGPEEAAVAANLCREAGLDRRWSYEVLARLRLRRPQPVVSWWSPISPS
jgi:hypothetical protein